MKQFFKSAVRDALPRRYQVPIKYWYSKLSGHLEPEMELLSMLFKPSELVIDIGANRGIYAYQLAKLGATIELFEPNPACAQVLKSWASKKVNVNLNTFALSDFEGIANLQIPVDASGVEHDSSASIEKSVNGHFREQVVRLATLDSFDFHQVSLIKIDVEGHEFSVLQGAQQTIASNKPALLLEIERRHSRNSFARTFNWLLDQGYQSFFLDAGALRPLSEFDVDEDQPIENLGKKNVKYINNFLFFHVNRLENCAYSQLFDRWGQ